MTIAAVIGKEIPGIGERNQVVFDGLFKCGGKPLAWNENNEHTILLYRGDDPEYLMQNFRNYMFDIFRKEKNHLEYVNVMEFFNQKCEIVLDYEDALLRRYRPELFEDAG